MISYKHMLTFTSDEHEHHNRYQQSEANTNSYQKMKKMKNSLGFF